MSVPTNIYGRANTSAIANAVREDLEDIIYNISPMDTYFLSHIEKSTAKNTLHDWNVDTLTAATSANAFVEGDDFSAQAAADTTKYRNYTQILRKEVVVSGSLDAVNQAGKSTETAYQVMKKGKELKRDLEVTLLGNGWGGSGASAGANASPRTMAGVENWLFSTAHIKLTGQTTSTTTAPVSGVANNTPNDGSTTALLEADVQTALATAWANGGDVDVIITPTVPKRRIDGFTGIATRFRDVGAGQQAQIIGAADVYVSDFGSHKVVLSRYVRSTTVLFLEMDLWGIAYLRPFQTIDIAKSGDSTKKMILCEATLVAKNPLGHAKVTGAL